jgi:hypothetical protein
MQHRSLDLRASLSRQPHSKQNNSSISNDITREKRHAQSLPQLAFVLPYSALAAPKESGAQKFIRENSLWQQQSARTRVAIAMPKMAASAVHTVRRMNSILFAAAVTPTATPPLCTVRVHSSSMIAAAVVSRISMFSKGIIVYVEQG